VNSHHKTLVTQDSQIESANKKLKIAHASVARAEDHLLETQGQALANPHSEKYRMDLDKATRTWDNAGKAYAKAVDGSIETIGTGSGRVMVLLPSRAADAP
jgi:hypothetical protein